MHVIGKPLRIDDYALRLKVVRNWESNLFLFDGRYAAPAPLRWLERRIDTGPQNWKQYAFALLVSNVAFFAVSFLVLATQPFHPAFLNPDHKGMLEPTTIFNTCSDWLIIGPHMLAQEKFLEAIKVTSATIWRSWDCGFSHESQNRP